MIGVMTMEKLKPCPFCGEKPLVRMVDLRCITVADNVALRDEWYRVCCGNASCVCNTRTKKFLSKDEAIEAWNRRVDNA